MVMVDTGRTSPSPPGIFILDDGVGLVAKRVDAVPNSFPQQLRCHPTIRPTAITSAASTRSASLAVLSGSPAASRPHDAMILNCHENDVTKKGQP